MCKYAVVGTYNFDSLALSVTKIRLANFTSAWNLSIHVQSLPILFNIMSSSRICIQYAESVCNWVAYLINRISQQCCIGK